MKHFSFLFLGIFSSFVFASCNNNRFKINTVDSLSGVRIERIDKQLLAMDTANIASGLEVLSAEYPEFYEKYVGIWELETTDTFQVCELFRNFLTDSLQAVVHADVLNVFADVSDIEKSLSTGYAYINHYFPEIKLPRIYFFVGGFNRSVIEGSDFIAIGSDLYLGRDYPFYKTLTYDYLIHNMAPESIPVDVISTIITRAFRYDSEKDRLVDNILYRGKMLYILSVFLPDESRENIIGYSSGQWKWCQQREKQIWGSMIDQKHLFSTDLQLVRKYVNDAPFTAPVSQDSPGRLGVWVGWRIVESYMKKNKDVSLRQLVEMKDYQKLLEQSSYRP
ncbi:MAG: hypothetical protein LBS07_04520 [Prevotellaceae bacterium]|jgi:hypothetical protein|nr:hypothetical protein [Prevotellaceae bacterium]